LFVSIRIFTTTAIIIIPVNGNKIFQYRYYLAGGKKHRSSAAPAASSLCVCVCLLLLVVVAVCSCCPTFDLLNEICCRRHPAERGGCKHIGCEEDEEACCSEMNDD